MPGAMPPAGASIAFFAGVVSAVAYALLFIYLLFRASAGGPTERSRSLVIAALAASAAWAAASAWAEWSWYTWPGHVATALDVIRYATWLMFLVHLLRPAGGPAAGAADLATRARTLSRATTVVVLLALGALVQKVLAGADAASDVAHYHLVPALALPVIGLVLLEQLFRNLVADSRWSAKPVCLGLASVFAFDIYIYAEAVLLGRIDPDARAVRPLVHTLLVPFLFLAYHRRADWARNLQISRRAVFYSAALLLAGGYLLFIAGVGYYVRYFGGEWGRALQLGLLFAGGVALCVLVMSASLRARVRVFIGKHFFSYRYDYREEWLAFTTMLASGERGQGVGVLVVRALANIVECPAGSLWTRHGAEGHYAQAACWNAQQCTATEPAQSGLVSFMADRSWIVDIAEVQTRPGIYQGLQLPAWLLGDERAWAVIPLASGEALLGFVVLEKPRTPVDLDWETRDLLKAASRQAAGYLAQMQATEALLESRKFDAFNRMSAFVVHDLKNIVTQLSLMMKNAQRHRDNPEFQQDMLLTVESSLEKMKRMMLQLREGATSPEGSRGVELQPLVGRLVAQARSAGRQVDAVVAEPLATRGHEDRLERVLGHLVQNALDATPVHGKVWLHIERFSGQVRVQIGDTGQGMSDEFLRTRLFKPFSSTKHAGMGIGAYESAQYIRELGGSIEATSKLGEGTLITVVLPLLDLHRGSDLDAVTT